MNWMLLLVLAAESSPFAELEWRNIGPAVMGGRASDIEGVPGNPRIVYAAAASGGVWKTTDGGVKWHPIFDEQPVASIGDIALEPGNPEVLYVGTGEANLRNSVSFGNGVYKSTDGGESWTHLGLADTRHISRIVIDPREPKRVYVGALGHAFGPNEERGVFRSVDGGEHWEKVLYVDERHGVSDLAIDTENPNIIFAAFWHFERKPWTLESGSEEGGVYKSVDGGSTWKKLEDGLPELVGRIGVRVAPSAPNVVYVIAESKEGTLFRSDEAAENALELFPDYHYALAELGHIRMAQGKSDEAVSLFEARYRMAPHPENLYELAKAKRRAGGGTEADAANLFSEFERLAILESEANDNANRELVFYYADVANDSSAALGIARLASGRRQDVFTLDAYAWALFRSGSAEEAWEQMETALAPGIQDAKFLYHAGCIRAALADSERATRYWERSIRLDPYSEVAAAAKRALDEHGPTAGN